MVSGSYDLETAVKEMAEAEREKERARAEFQAQREAQEKAIVALNDRIEQDPENVPLRIERAQAYLGASFTTDLSYSPAHLLQSMQDYKTALELDPADPHHVAEHLAFFEAWQDRTDSRIEKLKAFTGTYPDSIRVPFAAYALYYDAHEKGDADQALSYLTRAADTAPEGRFGTAMRDMLAQTNHSRRK
jgi:tetratricopeptide (TPR) repeat protein